MIDPCGEGLVIELTLLAGAAVDMRIEIVKTEASAVIVIESAIVMVTEETGIGSTSKLSCWHKICRAGADEIVMIGEETGIDLGHHRNGGSCRMSCAYLQ